MQTTEGQQARGSVTLTGATAIVIGNMIGTGVFTSLGYQVESIQSGFLLMMIWVLGGVVAFCGAVSYGELAAALPRSGGEYHFLSRIYHPFVGFLSGWVSITVGFAAPVALSAMAFGSYLTGVFAIPAPWLSCGALLVCTLAHFWTVGLGSRFQSWLSFLKVAIIVALAAAGFVVGDAQPVRFVPAPDDFRIGLLGPVAIGLFFVMYSYSGWNAATYIVSEVRNPQRTVPRSLVLGSLVVTAVYVSLNAAFLFSTPMRDLAGKTEVGLIAGGAIMGPVGGRVMAALISFGLISSISAMMWAGPRVAQTMGEDYRLFRWLGKSSPRGVPRFAICWQCAIVLVLLFTSTFQAVLFFIEFILIVFSFLTVLGVFYLRLRQPDLPRPYRTWGYPVTPLIFLGTSLYLVVFCLKLRTTEALWGIAILVAGALVYVIARRLERET